MLAARTGSEQLISMRKDERSYSERSLSGTRRARNCRVKFGTHPRVHRYSEISCNMLPGCMTQSVGDCITTGK